VKREREQREAKEHSDLAEREAREVARQQRRLEVRREYTNKSMEELGARRAVGSVRVIVIRVSSHSEERGRGSYRRFLLESR
jgi:hypothetical protein